MESSKLKVLVVGAGGCGVSNIAQIYLQQGHNVIGVDKQINAATANLISKGIKVYSDSQFEVLQDINLVFRSSAIPDKHPLIEEAKKKGITVISRIEFFEKLSLEKEIIAVAGSSGKTSTTGILSHIISGNRDCGYLVGIHGNGGWWGKHDDFILEADEYAKTFLSLRKVKMTLITGLRYDHIDIYPTQAAYTEAFRSFAANTLASGGKLIINGDDEYLRESMTDFKYITYGKKNINDWSCRNIANFEGGSEFDVFHYDQFVTRIRLNIIGGHNVMNALAGFVAAWENSVPQQIIKERLGNFTGLPRRLQQLRSTPYFVYDDYAHLPGEIETVLTGLRESFPTRRLLCYFQPHTYKRINAFFTEYSKALSNCDVLFLGDVYAARDTEGSVDLSSLLNKTECKTKMLSGDIEQTINLIETEIQAEDVLVCLNAGTGTKVAHYFERFERPTRQFSSVALR